MSRRRKHHSKVPGTDLFRVKSKPTFREKQGQDSKNVTNSINKHFSTTNNLPVSGNCSGSYVQTESCFMLCRQNKERYKLAYIYSIIHLGIRTHWLLFVAFKALRLYSQKDVIVYERENVK